MIRNEAENSSNAIAVLKEKEKNVMIVDMESNSSCQSLLIENECQMNLGDVVKNIQVSPWTEFEPTLNLITPNRVPNIDNQFIMGPSLFNFPSHLNLHPNHNITTVKNFVLIEVIDSYKNPKKSPCAKSTLAYTVEEP